MTVSSLKLYLAVVVVVVSGVLVSVMKPAAIGEDEDGVKEIVGVKIHSNPSQPKLEELGVAEWPTWEGSPGQIPWTFSATETMYLLQGKVKVTCQGRDFEIGGRDLVVFPKGMTITWNVLEAVKKHYKLDDDA